MSPVIVSTFKTRQDYLDHRDRDLWPKVMIVTRMETLAPKAMTISMMATPKGPIPVTVGSCEAYRWGVGGMGGECTELEHIPRTWLPKIL